MIQSIITAVRIACCQFDAAWEDKPANHARVERLLSSAALPAGSLVLLPEMFATGYSMNVAGVDDGATGTTQRFVAELSRRLGLYILAGVVTRTVAARDGSIPTPFLGVSGEGEENPGRNEALIYGPEGQELARYQKLYPFSFAGEDKHYAAGIEVVMFEWGGLRVSPLICYDLRFPEPFRTAVRRGANVFAVIANWPAARESHWVALLQARAIENQAYVAGVNRCGQDPNHSYNGRSLIIDPRGNILAAAGDGEQVIWADVDAAAVTAYRQEFPALADLRASDAS